MKLNSLDLIAFGPFTNSSLNLANGTFGCHIVYGANEAGKSSALRAVDALLFGIPIRTTDNFRHEHGQLRVGGTFMDADGKTISLIRRKGSKSTILDKDNIPLDDNILDSLLGGMDRDSFTHLFGINHDTLKSGGQELLQLGGEVGQSLFAASMGGISVRDMLKSLDSEADDLFQARGKKNIITNLVKSYEEKRDIIRKSSLSSNEWISQQKQVSNLDAEVKKLQRDIADITLEKVKLTRVKNVLPDLSARRELLAELDALDGVLILPEDMSDILRDVLDRIRAGNDAAIRAEGDLNVLQQKLRTLTVSDELLRDDRTITELHQRLGNYVKAQHDSVKLSAQLTQLNDEIRQSVNNFPLPVVMDDIVNLFVSKPLRQHLRELTEKSQNMTTLRNRTEQDILKLQRKLTHAKNDLAVIPAAMPVQSLLDALTRIRRHGDLDEILRKHELSFKAAEKEASQYLSRLSGWKGTIEDAEKLIIPSEETVILYAKQMGKTDDAINGYKDKIAKLEDDKKEINQQIEEIERAGEVLTEDDLIKSRECREKRWRLIRGKWIDRTISDITGDDINELSLPDSYENSVADADNTADRLRREADRTARMGGLIARLNRCETDIADMNKLLNDNMEIREKIQTDWEDKWVSANIIPSSPEEMRSWLSKFQQALTAIAAMRQAEQQMESVKQTQKIIITEICHELELINENKDIAGEQFGALIDRTAAIAASHTDAARKRGEAESILRKTEQEIDDANADIENLRNDLADWQTKWLSAVSTLKLPDTVSPAEVEIFLDALTELHDKKGKFDGLAERITGIERDTAEFADDINELLKRLGKYPDNRTFAEIINEIHAQLLQTREVAATRKECMAQIEIQNENMRKSVESRTLAEKELNEMCKTAGCDTADELKTAISRSVAVLRLRERIEMLNTSIQRLSDGKTFSELEIESTEFDVDSIPARLSEIDNELSDKNADIENLRQQYWEALSILREMDGKSQAADAANEAQQLLADLRLPVERYIRLKLTAYLMRDAIEQYRIANQSPLLSRAGILFAHLTLNQFKSIIVDFDESDNQIIKGVRESGENVEISGMSDGTRDQLYLALRIASIERYLAANPPVPFIVDDILITFDDARATAAMELLAELSEKTQVIFFTHHRRLVELAENMNRPDVLFVQNI